MTSGYRIFALSALALATPGTVLAQEIGETSAIVIAPGLDRTDAAGARKEEGYSPRPIDAGPFLLEPSVSLVVGVDSNVFNKSNGVSDIVANFTPKLVARANTSRHLFRIDAAGHFRRFASESTENSEEYRLGALSRFDISPTSSFDVSASQARVVEPRSSVGTIANAAEPVSYSLTQAQVGADLEFGALTIAPQGRYYRSNYSTVDLSTGGSADLSFRDLRRYGADLAIGYKVSGLVETFGQVKYSDSESVNPAPNAARDSTDWQALGGIRGQLSPVISAELSAGYRERDYDLALFQDYQGFTYAADFQWFITPLVTLRLEADQDFINSADAQIAGILTNRVAVSGYYDPLRNLRISASVAYEHFDFRETATSAQRPSFRLASQYFLNSNLSLGAFVSVRRQTVDGPRLVEPYTSFSTGLGITLTP